MVNHRWVRLKKNKKGLKGRIKIFAQVMLGLFIGLTVYFHPEITTRDSNLISENKTQAQK